VGQIVENGLTRTFRYDIYDHLTESPGWLSYTYGGNANRATEWVDGSSLSYAYGWERITSASGPGAVKRWSYAYDYQTNLSGIGKYNAWGGALEKAACLRHDPLGRMVLVGTAFATYVWPDSMYCALDTQVTQVTARFKYDFRNRRIASWKAETGEWVYTVFDQAGQPLAEIARTSDPVNPWRPVREYVWLEGKPIAQIEHDAITGAARTYAVHTDAIGLPRALTSPTGVTVWSATPARPYGDITEVTTPDPETGKTVVTNLRLPGQYDERLLGALGLQGPYYNWNRWYLPGVGRYLELDPIAKAGGFNGFYGPNWYGYAEGNPLRWTDPRGLTTYECMQPLHALLPLFGDEVPLFGPPPRKSGWDNEWSPLYHNYLCVLSGDGKPACGGKDKEGGAPWGPGIPSQDTFHADRRCKPISDNNKCYDDCIRDWIHPETPRGYYFLGFTDCQTFVYQGKHTCYEQCNR
jgi:RHS repeat-associated protein